MSSINNPFNKLEELFNEKSTIKQEYYDCLGQVNLATNNKSFTVRVLEKLWTNAGSPPIQEDHWDLEDWANTHLIDNVEALRKATIDVLTEEANRLSLEDQNLLDANIYRLYNPQTQVENWGWQNRFRDLGFFYSVFIPQSTQDRNTLQQKIISSATAQFETLKAQGWQFINDHFDGPLNRAESYDLAQEFYMRHNHPSSSSANGAGPAPQPQVLQPKESLQQSSNNSSTAAKKPPVNGIKLPALLQQSSNNSATAKKTPVNGIKLPLPVKKAAQSQATLEVKVSSTFQKTAPSLSEDPAQKAAKATAKQVSKSVKMTPSLPKKPLQYPHSGNSNNNSAAQEVPFLDDEIQQSSSQRSSSNVNSIPTNDTTHLAIDKAKPKELRELWNNFETYFVLQVDPTDHFNEDPGPYFNNPMSILHVNNPIGLLTPSNLNDFQKIKHRFFNEVFAELERSIPGFSEQFLTKIDYTIQSGPYVMTLPGLRRIMVAIFQDEFNRLTQDQKNQVYLNIHHLSNRLDLRVGVEISWGEKHLFTNLGRFYAVFVASSYPNREQKQQQISQWAQRIFQTLQKEKIFLDAQHAYALEDDTPFLNVTFYSETIRGSEINGGHPGYTKSIPLVTTLLNPNANNVAASSSAAQAGPVASNANNVAASSSAAQASPVASNTNNVAASSSAAQAGQVAQPAIQNLGSAQAAAPIDEDKDLCVICMDNKADMVAVPCGHMFACAECIATIANCSICRKKIDTKVKLFKVT